MEVVDHSITEESFTLRACLECGFLHTHPQPTANAIGRYYASEDYVSHSETRRGLINRIYGAVQGYNIRYKYRLVNRDVPRGTWLDYGSGAGAFMEYAHSHGKEIIGLEPDTDARTRAESRGMTVYDTDHLAHLPDESIAAVTMWHVLEHVHDIHDLLRQIRRILRPGGKLVIAVPHPYSYDALRYQSHWAALDVPRHLWHFRKRDIIRLANDHGFAERSKHPLWLDSFYVSMLSEKYKNGNLIRGIWVGFLSNFYARFSGYPYSSQIYVLRKTE